jgi:hypothetical protein
MVVMFDPLPNDDLGSFKTVEDLSIKQVDSESAVKALTKTILPGATGFNVGAVFTPMPDNQLRSSFAINSGPLSLRMYSGITLSIMAFASCSIIWIDLILLTEEMVRHFRVYSSIMVSILILQPYASLIKTKWPKEIPMGRNSTHD